jgi:hypothetical protein
MTSNKNEYIPNCTGNKIRCKKEQEN